MTGPQRDSKTMKPELNSTPLMIIPQTARMVSFESGNSKISHPSQCSSGIGIHRNAIVMIPIPVVMELL